MRSSAVLAVLGWSGTGKTTLMEALIREMSRRGLRTAAVKFTSHVHGGGEGQPGKRKDTERFLRAGAESAFLVEGRLGTAGEEGSGAEGGLPPRVWEAVEGADAVLSEGRRLPGACTVLLHREGCGEPGPKYPPEEADRFFLGGAGQEGTVPAGAVRELADELESGVRMERSPNGAEIEGELKRRRNMAQRSQRKGPARTVEFRAGGKRVGLNGFVRDIFLEVILGLVRPLQGVNPEAELEIRIGADREGSDQPDPPGADEPGREPPG